MEENNNNPNGATKMRNVTVTRPRRRAEDYPDPCAPIYDHLGREILRVRAGGGCFLIKIAAGEPSIRVRQLGAFADSLVARRLGHSNFALRPV